MTIRRVGLIGAGLMGHGIGKNILAKGYQITVMADNLGYGERFVPRSIDVLMKVNGLRD